MGLLGAFIDLAVAYVLLCCASVAYLLSYFLSFFGLGFPCTCNGLSEYSSTAPCLQALLVDYPRDKISSVQFSLRSKFPFDTAWALNDDYELHFKILSEKRLDNGLVELEGEASCSRFSVSDARRSPAAVPNDSVGKHEVFSGTNEGQIDVKGKGASPHRLRPGIRRRHRSKADLSKLTSYSSSDIMKLNTEHVGHPQYGYSSKGNDITSEDSDHSNAFDSHAAMAKSSWCDSGSECPADEKKDEDNDAVSLESDRSNTTRELLVDPHDENAIKILSQALKEEHATQNTLCSELEKERIAAATAADEAMAMISRLQEEKAAIELEARQYQRILEEKSAYDYEEMNILKEIIVRREWEKHFLEKEVESYKKMLEENEEYLGDACDTTNDSTLNYSNEDQPSIVHQVSGSGGEKERMLDVNDILDYASSSCENNQRNSSLSQHNLDFHDPQSLEFQEKGIVEQVQKNDNLYLDSGSLLKYEGHSISKMSGGDDGGGSNLQCEDTYPKEQHVYDVHVVDDTTLCGTATSIEMDQRICRSKSETPSVLLSLTKSCSDYKLKPRHSISSTIDNEKVKLNNEVGLLRERLRNIRAGRDKLHLSLEHLEKDKTQLILLEDIASLLREIRQLSEPQKAASRISLPPHPSKATSKKRRCKGSSSGVYLSS